MYTFASLSTYSSFLSFIHSLYLSPILNYNFHLPKEYINLILPISPSITALITTASFPDETNLDPSISTQFTLHSPTGIPNKQLARYNTSTSCDHRFK